jgi:TolA-binding protein
VTCQRSSMVPAGSRIAALPANLTTMSLFKQLFRPKDTTSLEERIRNLETQVRRLEEDWTEVYGKFRTLQMRVAKQVQRLDENSAQEAEHPEPAGGDGTGESLRPGMSLSARQMQVNAEILARRNRKAG